MNFKEIREKWKLFGNGEPEVAIEIYILGAILYETNELEGESVCSLVLPKKELKEDKKYLNNYCLDQKEKKNLENSKNNPNIIRSYFRNGNNLKLNLRKKEVARGRAKLLIKSKLQNESTEIFLIKEDRFWKIYKGTEMITKLDV